MVKNKVGRPRVLPDDTLEAILKTYRKGEVGYKATAKRLNVSIETVRYYVNKGKK